MNPLEFLAQHKLAALVIGGGLAAAVALSYLRHRSGTGQSSPAGSTLLTPSDAAGYDASAYTSGYDAGAGIDPGQFLVPQGGYAGPAQIGPVAITVTGQPNGGTTHPTSTHKSTPPPAKPKTPVKPKSHATTTDLAWDAWKASGFSKSPSNVAWDEYAALRYGVLVK